LPGHGILGCETEAVEAIALYLLVKYIACARQAFLILVADLALPVCEL
jgi:hypothetical protein